MDWIIRQVVADTGRWGHMSGWGWMAVGWLFWLGVAALIWVVLRAVSPAGASRKDPEEVLAERFARGDIAIQEFGERRAALRD